MTPLPRRALQDVDGPFDVTVLEAAAPTRVVSFIAGRGGDPDRHAPLLLALAERGCTVIAPRYPLLAAPRVDEAILSTRARRASLALDAFAPPGLPVVGLGHSLGASAQLVLAGAKAWLRPEHPLEHPTDPRLARLLLFAPAISFLHAPQALDAVRIPLTIWAGSEDPLTPPSAVKALADALAPSVPCEVRIAEGAGHFSFMHVPPPNTTEPLADRDAFLAELVRAVADVVMG